VILADENIIGAVVMRLRADGHDVEWIVELAPSIADVHVLERAFVGGRVLLTDDKDFGELVVLESRPNRGVVLLRLAGMRPADRADLVARLFAGGVQPFVDAFTVVQADGRVRTRRFTALPGE
jgi:predicted nuclease of predicted toxin-antitoxin system